MKSGFALMKKRMEFFLSYLFLGEEELRKAAPETKSLKEELRLNEVPYFILTKYTHTHRELHEMKAAPSFHFRSVL